MSTRIWKNPKNPDDYSITFVDVSGNTISSNEEQIKSWELVATVPGHLRCTYMEHPDLRAVIYDKDVIIGLLTGAQKELEDTKSTLYSDTKFYFSKSLIEKIQNELEKTKSKV